MVRRAGRGSFSPDERAQLIQALRDARLEYQEGIWRSAEPLTHAQWWNRYVKPSLAM